MTNNKGKDKREATLIEKFNIFYSSNKADKVGNICSKYSCEVISKLNTWNF